MSNCQKLLAAYADCIKKHPREAKVGLPTALRCKVQEMTNSEPQNIKYWSKTLLIGIQ